MPSPHPGVAVGMGMVGLEEIVEVGAALKERGYKRVTPYFIPKILINMAAGHISLKHGLKVGKSHHIVHLVSFFPYFI